MVRKKEGGGEGSLEKREYEEAIREVSFIYLFIYLFNYLIIICLERDMTILFFIITKKKKKDAFM